MHHKTPPPTPFLDCRETVDRHRTLLPHWQQENRFQFVTWCLGDAVPGPVLRRWKTEKDLWLSLHPKPWSEAVLREYGEKFGGKVDQWLDQGRGSCCLRRRDCAEIVSQVIRTSDGDSVNLDVMVVMPNHVHVLFFPKEEIRLESLLQQWKGISSHKINQELQRKGSLWMRDYWDRMIRGPEHYDHVRKYILSNPAKAGLAAGHHLLWSASVPVWDQLKEKGYSVRARNS